MSKKPESLLNEKESAFLAALSERFEKSLIGNNNRHNSYTVRATDDELKENLGSSWEEKLSQAGVKAIKNKAHGYDVAFNRKEFEDNIIKKLPQNETTRNLIDSVKLTMTDKNYKTFGRE
jgi:hypothetical protein